MARNMVQFQKGLSAADTSTLFGPTHTTANWHLV